MKICPGTLLNYFLLIHICFSHNTLQLKTACPPRDVPTWVVCWAHLWSDHSWNTQLAATYANNWLLLNNQWNVEVPMPWNQNSSCHPSSIPHTFPHFTFSGKLLKFELIVDTQPDGSSDFQNYKIINVSYTFVINHIKQSKRRRQRERERGRERERERERERKIIFFPQFFFLKFFIMPIFVCVCMRASVYVYVCKCVSVCECVCMYVGMNVCIDGCMIVYISYSGKVVYQKPKLTILIMGIYSCCTYSSLMAPHRGIFMTTFQKKLPVLECGHQTEVLAKVHLSRFRQSLKILQNWQIFCHAMQSSVESCHKVFYSSSSQ